MALTQVDGGLLSPTNAQYTGFKNRIINGAMMIDQRNAGAAINSAASGSFGVDRFKYESSPQSKFNIQQNAGSVTPPAGFSKYLGFTTASAYSVAAGDLFYVTQPIEGQNVSDLNWGSANASAVTLSFWVRSSLTGTFGGSISNSAQNRSYPFSYTISSANTWEQKTITIPGDTTGTWLTTNGIGMYVFWSLGTGTTYSGTAGAWAGTQYNSATGATSVVGTLNATFYITGVQLEKGSTATSFDYRSYGTELALCQRYFQSYTEALFEVTGYGYNTSSGLKEVFSFPTMRASPIATITNGTNGGALSALTVVNIGKSACTFKVDPTSASQAMYYQWNMTLSSEL